MGQVSLVLHVMLIEYNGTNSLMQCESFLITKENFCSFVLPLYTPRVKHPFNYIWRSIPGELSIPLIAFCRQSLEGSSLKICTQESPLVAHKKLHFSLITHDCCCIHSSSTWVISVTRQAPVRHHQGRSPPLSHAPIDVILTL